MKIELIHIHNIPSKEQIESILGTIIYEYYNLFCLRVISLLMPKIEIWAGESRRGKVYHGFKDLSKSDILEIEMWMNDRQLKCAFRFSRRKFDSLTHIKGKFCKEIQASIDAWNNYNNENNSHYYNIDIFLNERTFSGALKLLE
jgi:hypothetical protein